MVLGGAGLLLDFLCRHLYDTYVPGHSSSDEIETFVVSALRHFLCYVSFTPPLSPAAADTGDWPFAVSGCIFRVKKIFFLYKKNNFFFPSTDLEIVIMRSEPLPDIDNVPFRVSAWAFGGDGANQNRPNSFFPPSTG